MPCCKLTVRTRLSIRILFLLAAMMAVFADGLLAQGGRAGAFLRLGLGARAKAMGNTGVAMAYGVETSYYNPAGLPLLDSREVLLSYRSLTLDRTFAFVGIALPVRPKVESGEKPLLGGLALTWTHAGVGNIDGRGTDGQSIGELSNSENAFALSFGLNPAKILALGVSVKVLWNRFPGIGLDGATLSSSGVGFDLGAMLMPTDWFMLGVAVKDINSKYTWNTDKLFGEDDGSETPNKFPTIVRGGIALRLPHEGLSLAFDYEDSSELAGQFHVGAEQVLADKVGLRLGLDDGSVAAGFGYKFGVLGAKSQLSYAFVAANDRPEAEHIFTWVFKF